MIGQNLKSLVESEGAHAVSRKLADLLIAKKIKADDISIRELWESLVGPCVETLDSYARRDRVNFVGLREAHVDSTAFANIQGVLIASMVIDGYKAPGYIGELLTTNFPSKLKSERVAGFTAVEGLIEVHEGMPYEDSDLGEKFVTTETKKKGRLISITEEAIYFDQTGQLLLRAKMLGERARLDKEKTILQGIVLADNAAYYSYRPAGTATALYAQAWEALAANPLVDWRDIEEAELQQGEAVDEQGETIVVMSPVILVPKRLYRTAKRIVNMTEVVMTWQDTNNTEKPSDAFDLEPREKGSNPLAGDYVVLTSPLIHKLQIAASVEAANAKGWWWIGDFKKEFFWQEIWPITVMQAKAGHEEEFNKDIIMKYKVRHYGGVFAVDNKYVLKNAIA